MTRTRFVVALIALGALLLALGVAVIGVYKVD